MSKVLILLVEDNPGDAELTRQALASSKLGAELLVLDDGEKALRYLRGEPPYRGAALPDLLLLDLNLPKIPGEELLAEIKGDERLRALPVVIFTSSDAEAEVSRCYAQGANCYVVKPTDFQSYLGVVAAIETFWLSVARGNPSGKKAEKK
jgi:two-component system, chemotaxis family, response regulator Rcp1